MYTEGKILTAEDYRRLRKIAELNIPEDLRGRFEKYRSYTNKFKYASIREG